MIIIVMGVAGAGKSTVGRCLAEEFGWPFFEGDDLHEGAMIEKMKAGRALTGEDREAWLERVGALVRDLDREGCPGVIACSALKNAYRQRIAGNSPNVRFVYLKASYDLTRERLERRQQHFMKAELLDSQFKALEEPASAVIIDGSLPPETIVNEIREALHLAGELRRAKK